MPGGRYLTGRQDRKLGEIVAKVDGGAVRTDRFRSDSKDNTGTDNGFAAVPRTTIAAKSQSSGSATLGGGTAWLYRVNEITGDLSEVLDPRTGQHIFLPVRNMTATIFEPSQTSNKIEVDTPLLAVTQTRHRIYLVSPFGEVTTMPSVQLKKAYVNQSTIENNTTGDIRLLQREFIVVSVSKANPAVVTTSSPHGYASGNTVRVYADYSDNLLDGMKELSAWKDHTITVTGTTTFTIPEDTTTYADFTTGRCARTTAETGVNRDTFGQMGKLYYKHDFVWVQQRTEDNNWDIIKPHFSGPQFGLTQEIIARQAEGDGILADSDMRCRIFYDWIAPGATQLNSAANCSLFYWKTVPIEDGGAVGRPYVFRVANANCDNIGDT